MRRQQLTGWTKKACGYAGFEMRRNKLFNGPISQANSRAFQQLIQAATQTMAWPEVIGVQEGNDVAVCRTEAGVASGSNPLIGLADAYDFRTKLYQNIFCIVGRTVVHNNYLVWNTILHQYTM